MHYHYTKLSLLYPIFILITSGLALLSFPHVVFQWLGSNSIPESQWAHLLGMMFLGLGWLVSLVYYYAVFHIFRWTLYIRTMFVVVAIILFITAKNPFFLTLAGIIMMGMVLTLLGLWKDKKNASP